MRRKRFLCAGAALLGVLIACVSSQAADTSQKKPRYLDPRAPVEQRVSDLLARMTLRQKIGQMNQHGSSVGRQLLISSSVGSVLSIKNTRRIDQIQQLAESGPLKIPLLVAIDAVHGHCGYTGATVFPTAIGMASTWNVRLIQEASAVTAKEMRVTGYNWNLTPYISVSRDPRWGRVGENFGEDPFLVSQMGVATIKGLQGDDLSQPYSVLACIKVLVGDGQSINGLNYAPMDVSERTLREIFLPPFEAGVRAGAVTVMGAHNEVNGVPCHASKFLLTDILRKEFGFRGFVISDMGDIENLARIHRVAANNTDAVRQAVMAGIDIHMCGGGFTGPLERLVASKLVPEERINEAVAAILAAKFRLGLFEKRYTDARQIKQVLACRRHRELALQVARESIVLLKNSGGLLPLKKTQSIFVTGPNANNNALLGDWTEPQPAENVSTVLEGIRSVLSSDAKIDYYDYGKITGTSETNIRKAAERARKADVAVVVIGGNDTRCNEQWRKDKWRPERTGGEDVARSNIDLVGRQLELVQAVHKTGTPTVVVLINGRPLAVEWIADNVPAIVEAWQGGMEGGRAVAEVLFGDYNPSGRLPITIPRSVGEIQSCYNYRPSARLRKYKYGKTGPLWNFGHGLSYTTFSYADLRVPEKLSPGKDLKISVQVENTGRRKGREVVPVYINDVVSSVTTPVRELKAFSKIALEPGAKRRLDFIIPYGRLALYDRQMRRVVEPGAFEIFVGRLAGKFTVTGE